MRKVTFDCCKISNKLLLDRISDYFRLDRPNSRKNFAALNPEQTGSMLRQKPSCKFAYLYEFGCIVFINFKSYEIDEAIKYLESLVGKVDYNLCARYRHHYSIKPSENHFKISKNSTQTFEYDDGILPVVAELLAKSTALYKIEHDVIKLMDDSEDLLRNLNMGRLHSNTRRYMSSIANMVGFEYDMINNLSIFEKLSDASKNYEHRKLYDALGEYYEIHDRFTILEKKISEVRSLAGTYSELSFKYRENRLVLFEVFLLTLFLIPDVLKLIA